jgi:hypothetical protein
MNDSTLHVDVWNAIRTALVSTSIYITNSSTGATTAASIEASYNDKSGRPQIIIVPISIAESEFRFGSSYGKRFIDVTLECYYKNTLGIDQMADQVESIIRGAVLPNFGMELIGVVSDYSYAGINENKNHLKSITFSFDRE